jgi:hypothetical protein
VNKSSRFKSRRNYLRIFDWLNMNPSFRWFPATNWTNYNISYLLHDLLSELGLQIKFRYFTDWWIIRFNQPHLNDCGSLSYNLRRRSLTEMSINSKAHQFNFKRPLNNKIMYFFPTFYFSVVNEKQTNSPSAVFYGNCGRHLRILLNVEIIKTLSVFFYKDTLGVLL